MRFDKFIDTFTLIKDAKTKELLITPKTKLKIAATRLGIASGYYIDPPGVNMFRELGRDELGRMKYACYRGTNGLEVIINKIKLIYILNCIQVFNCINHLSLLKRVITDTYVISYEDTDAVQSLPTISSDTSTSDGI